MNEDVMKMRKRIRRKNKIKLTITGWLFISPVIIGILIFTAVPLVKSFYYALSNYNSIKPPEFIGLQNYKDLFKDDLFLHSLKITFKYAAISVPVNLLLSFSFGLLMNANIKGIGFFRFLAYLPCVIPGVASAIIWKDLFNPTSVGRFNQLITALGFKPFPWLTDPKTALFSMFFMGLWGLGGGMLMWLANLKGRSQSYYEVARLEGASRAQQLWHVTIPFMTPLIFYHLVTGVIGSLQAFGASFLMTGGGPLNSTRFIGLLIYNTGLQEMNMGYACSMAWVLFAIIMVLTLLLFKSGGWVYYGEEQ